MKLIDILDKIGNYLLQELIRIFIVLLIPILIANYYYSLVTGYIINTLINLNSLYILPHLIEKTNMFISYVNVFTYLINYINSSMSIISIINLSTAIILGIILLFIEIKERKQFILKEIENININNNLKKIVIKLLNIMPLILAIIIVGSLLLLIIFPINITLINIIVIIPQIYIPIIFLNIILFILIEYSSNKKANINIEKNI